MSPAPEIPAPELVLYIGMYQKSMMYFLFHISMNCDESICGGIHTGICI